MFVAQAIGIMTKAPQAGYVKTRLQPPLTANQAARLSECFLKDTARTVETVSRIRGATPYAVYTPAGSEGLYRSLLPAGFQLLLQRGAHLGERLHNAGVDLRERRFDSWLLINADSPTMPPELLESALERVRDPEVDVVLGPAEDGGYYLIGLREPHSSMFERIDWSTERVLEQTTERAIASGLRIAMIDPWYDVDDPESLSRLRNELQSAPDGSFTAAFLRTL